MRSTNQLFYKTTTGKITYRNRHCWQRLHHIFAIYFRCIDLNNCVRLMDRILRSFHHRSNNFRPTLAKLATHFSEKMSCLVLGHQYIITYRPNYLSRQNRGTLMVALWILNIFENVYLSSSFLVNGYDISKDEGQII